MSTSVVTSDGFTVSVPHGEDGAAMLANLESEKPGDRKGRVLVDKGEPVEEGEAKEGLSKAASDLGKEGAKAAAAKRAAEAKEAKKQAKTEKPEEQEEAEKADSAEGDKDETGAEKIAAERKAARHDAEARIRELASERKAAEERAERAERELAQARRQRQAASLPQEQRPEPRQETREAAQDDPEPKLEDFTEIGDYTRAVASHATRQAIRAHEAEQAERSEAQARQNAIQGHVRTFTERLSGVSADDSAHQTKLAEFTGSVDKRLLDLQPSFMVAPHEKQPIHQLADEIMVSPHPREVLSYLTANPDEFQRIAALRTLRDVSRAMAIIEHNAQEAVTAATSTERDPPSQAKPPARAVAGSPNTADVEPGDDASFDAHYNFHTPRIRQARAR